MALTKAQLIDLNANELILDLDADTSLTADTDDQIDIKIGGADDFTFTANAFNVLTGSHATFADSANAKFGTGSDMLVYHDGSNSYITNAVGALKIATETSGIALTIGHTTSEVTIADNLTVTGTLTLGSGAELTEAELEFLDGITAGTAAASKALVLDGSKNIATIGTIGSGAITSTGIVTGTGFTAGSAVLAEAELELLDGLTAGTAIATKVVTTDGSIDTSGQRNLTITGELDAATGDFSGAVDVAGAFSLAGTAITSTAAEINFIDGGATVGTTAVANGDGIIHNDGGTMKVTSAATFKTYFQEGISTAYDDLTTGDAAVTIDTSSGNITVDSNAGLVSIDGHTGVTIASSNSGDITLDSVADINIDAGGADIVLKDGGTQFGKITNASTHITIYDGTTLNTTMAGANITFAGTVGSGAITSTGIVTGTAFTAGSAVLAEAELELLDGLTAGTAIASKVVTTDGSIDTTGQRNLTITGELDAATLDISGAVDIAGASVLHGLLTQDGGVVFNEASADVDFRIEDNGNANAFFIEGGSSAGNPRIGIGVGTGNIDHELHIQGDNPRLQLESTATGADNTGIIFNHTGTEKYEFWHDEDVGAFNFDQSVETDGWGFNFRTFPSGGSDNTVALTIKGDGVVGMGALATADLGVGLHVRTADSGASVSSSADELVLENNGNCGLTILSSTSGNGQINFGDSGDNDIGGIVYDHGGNSLRLIAGGVDELLHVYSDKIVVNEGSGDIDFRVESNGSSAMLFVDGGNNRVGVGTNSPSVELHVDQAAGEITEIRASAASIYTKLIADDASGFNELDFSTTLLVKEAGTEVMRIIAGEISTGAEAAPDVSVGGLCLDQNALDTKLLTFKSSDVAHGITDAQETDTYLSIGKASAAVGGGSLTGITETDIGMFMHGYAPSPSTAQDATGTCVVMTRGNDTSGTGGANVANAGNIFGCQNGGNLRFLVRGDGEIFSDIAANTYDTYDDAQLARAYDLSHGRGVIDSKFDKFVAYNHEKLAELELVGRKSDGTPNHFVNVTGMQRLHNGAIWQQYEKHQQLLEAVYDLAKVAVGEEKANAILDKHEVKRLN